MVCDKCGARLYDNIPFGIIVENIGPNPADVRDTNKVCLGCLARIMDERYGSGSWILRQPSVFWYDDRNPTLNPHRDEDVTIITMDEYEERIQELIQAVRDAIKNNKIDADELMTSLHALGQLHYDVENRTKEKHECRYSEGNRTARTERAAC